MNNKLRGNGAENRRIGQGGVGKEKGARTEVVLEREVVDDDPRCDNDFCLLTKCDPESEASGTKRLTETVDAVGNSENAASMAVAGERVGGQARIDAVKDGYAARRTKNS